MSQKNPANRPTRQYLENIKKQGHGSGLEHATYSPPLEGVSRSLTLELVRHRAGWAYCLAGETLVYSERRSGSKRDGPTKRRVRDLFAMTQSPHGRSRLKLLKLRCLDEATGSFIAGRVRTVVASGIKPVFGGTLEDGKTITCTREHRFLTPDGWRSLDDALGGLRVSGGGRALAGRSDGSLLGNGGPRSPSKEGGRGRGRGGGVGPLSPLVGSPAPIAESARFVDCRSPAVESRNQVPGRLAALTPDAPPSRGAPPPRAAPHG